MMRLLDISAIEAHWRDSNPFYPTGDSVADYCWGQADDEQKKLQTELKKAYTSWFEGFGLLTREAPYTVGKNIETTHKFISRWIDRDSNWGLPTTIPAAKQMFSQKIKTFLDILRLAETANKSVPIVVPDTNAIIAAPDPVQYSQVVGSSEYAFILVPTVLAELDQLKVMHRDPNFRSKVEGVINRIKGWRTQGSTLRGVTVNKTIIVKMIATEPNFEHTLGWLDATNQDDRIIASVLEIQREQPAAKVILVTSDINLQNKAEMANLPFVEPPP